jgi:hypothetical protein
MPSISIPRQDPWVVARWAFRELLDRTAAHLADEPLRKKLVAAEALDGLHLDLLDASDQLDMARALMAGCRELIADLTTRPLEPLDASYVAALKRLEEQLDEAFP